MDVQGKKTKLIAVVGPTASGKTETAIRIAQKFSGEIISADSMQIYSNMPIASAAPDEEEKKRAVHHLVGFLDPGVSFSVADYVKLAEEKIRDIEGRGMLPILCGGTGLYIDSVISGMKFQKEGEDSAVRERIRSRLDTEGADVLYAELMNKDPQAAETIHKNNIPRLVRALEVMEITGLTMTEYKKKAISAERPYDVLMIGLDYSDRDLLYKRIEKRIDMMVECGLIDEARKAFEISDRSATSVQAIGHKELFPYFEGTGTLAECIDELKKATRHYAKRQKTWFYRNKDIRWFFPDRYEDAACLYDEIEKECSAWLNR